ncbi:hypothetical protein [Klebsiella pneumoniae]|uniref:hypothetical protein n=1 Tax=Klebsiella pneumoniae TaxID=573 RepID=UPI000E2AECE9|nr:hypothetical protein [Klebsiella pneumoniae]MDI7146781.1 hypothetical protein [Klebsiella pneumoniae]SYF30552.1 Uncharacterised protein [Klebsiella pneumoniae]
MKVIKYWKVQLLQLSQPSSNLPGIMNARNLVESLLFEGYSKDKPKINLGSGVNIELFTAPDSLETRIFRDHLVDSVRCFPVCEDDGDDEIDGDREERTKSLSPVKGRNNYGTFKAASRPLIQWLNENANPHTSVIVDCTGAELLTGEVAFKTKEFLKD